MGAVLSAIFTDAGWLGAAIAVNVVMVAMILWLIGASALSEIDAGVASGSSERKPRQQPPSSRLSVSASNASYRCSKSSD